MPWIHEGGGHWEKATVPHSRDWRKMEVTGNCAWLSRAELSKPVWDLSQGWEAWNCDYPVAGGLKMGPIRVKNSQEIQLLGAQNGEIYLQSSTRFPTEEIRGKNPLLPAQGGKRNYFQTR